MTAGWLDRWIADMPDEARHLVLRAAIGRNKHERFTRLFSAHRPEDGGYSVRDMVERGFIFIHVPKTAGLSVARSVLGHRGGGHITAAMYLRLLGSRRFDALYKFAVVRNPYDRLASAYFFLRKGGMTEADRRYCARHLAQYPDFRSFVLAGLPRLKTPYKHLRPQFDFVVDPRTGRSSLDCTVRFESLAEDMAKAWAAIGKQAELAHLNRTDGKRPWAELYDEDMRRVCRTVYRHDFEAFRYD